MYSLVARTTCGAPDLFCRMFESMRVKPWWCSARQVLQWSHFSLPRLGVSLVFHLSFQSEEVVSVPAAQPLHELRRDHIVGWGAQRAFSAQRIRAAVAFGSDFESLRLRCGLFRDAHIPSYFQGGGADLGPVGSSCRDLAAPKSCGSVCSTAHSSLIDMKRDRIDS